MLPYKNPQLKIKDRVSDLLKRMTIEEKVGQVNQHLYGWQTYKWDNEKKQITLTDEFKKHVAWGKGLGAIYGLFRADPWSNVNYENGVPAHDSWIVSNAIQKYVIEHSRLGIPALIAEECPHGHQGLDSVSYPTNLGKGSTFNPDLIKKSAQLMSDELSNKGINLALVSTLDLAKDPRWGRTEECYGEDPLLTSRMTEAIVDGFQGSLITDDNFENETVAEANKDNRRIGVVLKHCIAQGETQGGHNSGTVVIGERDLKEIYTPILKSTRHAVGIMAAYNDINGIPCHANKHLLDEVLRKHDGFQGLIMADGLALDRLSDAIPNKLDAAESALDAGVDMSLWDDTYTNIAQGIKEHKISISALDSAVRHVLSIKFLLGLFDNPYIKNPNGRLDAIIKESQKINKQIAEESVVLAKNDDILPLKPKNKIAVIGPNANAFYNMLGDYTSPQTREMQRNTIYNAIKNEYSTSDVSFAEGCEIRNSANQDKKLSEAIKLAKESDVIILALGGSSTRDFGMNFMGNGAIESPEINMDTGENIDLASLELGGKQEELLEKLSETNKPIISILIQGRPYSINNVLKVSDAVLIGWYPGQMGGNAIADIICGKASPSGKLNISYPRNSQQLPVYYYQRDASKQDDYYDEPGSPELNFGFGLNYSQIKYKDLTVKKENNNLFVSVDAYNTGNYDEKESILVFTKLIGGKVLPRKRILTAFKKTNLKAGSHVKVDFEISYDDLKIYDYKMNHILPEKIQIMIGDQCKTISAK